MDRFCMCLAGALLASLIAASPADAIGVRNSECEPGHDGFAIISSAAEWAQTFPANRSGKLLTVELKGISRQPGGSEADIDVRLYGTDGSGTPVEPLLDSTTLPGEDITDDTFAHDYAVNFTPATAAYLTAGGTYAIAAMTADTVQNAWDYHDQDPCPEVELFSRYLSPFIGNAGDDAGLTTYVGPANDDFERAQELVGPEVAEEGTTAGATRQAGEPDHYVTNPPDSDAWVGDHSVWFRWKAPGSGPTTIDTCLGQIDSILAVYTGDELASLTRVTDNNNDPACSEDDVYGSKVSFEAIGGTTYEIAVGDAGGAREMPFAIRIAGQPAPPPPPPPGGTTGPASSTPAPTVATPPDTRIRRARISQAKARATFRFASTEPGSSFTCRIDRRPARPCRSPKSYGHLRAGRHSFSVDAVDAEGLADPSPALRRFRISSCCSSASGSP
jgi:hypothetical protein